MVQDYRRSGGCRRNSRLKAGRCQPAGVAHRDGIRPLACCIGSAVHRCKPAPDRTQAESSAARAGPDRSRTARACPASTSPCSPGRATIPIAAPIDLPLGTKRSVWVPGYSQGLEHLATADSVVADPGGHCRVARPGHPGHVFGPVATLSQSRGFAATPRSDAKLQPNQAGEVQHSPGLLLGMLAFAVPSGARHDQRRLASLWEESGPELRLEMSSLSDS